MKFLLISPFTSSSGSAIRFWNIARQLHNLGHRVIYIERKLKEGPLAKLPGIEYHTTPALPILVLDIGYSFFVNLFILLRNLDIDIYYALKPAPNNCFPALLAGMLGKKILLDIDDLDFGYFPPGVKRRLSEFFFRFFPKYFGLITCHTKKLQEYIHHDLSIPLERIYFLAQGVSQEFLTQQPLPVEQRIPQSIIYVATLGITSDFEDLVPILAGVFARCPNAIIDIVGDGVRRSHFEKLVKELGIEKNCRFAGRVPHDELPALVARHWIGINYMRSSPTNDCRAILKIREYLACGLNVVCNDVGDAAEFAEDCTIVPDIKSFGNSLNRLLECPGVPVDIGKLFSTKNLQWDVLVSKLVDRIKEIRSV